jgi:mannose-6-phosphate isomerase-like protein (cupin superfamily)
MPGEKQMRFKQANLIDDKGWCAGPWNSNLSISVGFANKVIDQPHVHSQITEIYLVVRGSAEIRVEKSTITLLAGDMIIVDPGEAHTFLSSSPDYYHFVIHTPGLTGEKARTEKSSIPRSRLGM